MIDCFAFFTNPDLDTGIVLSFEGSDDGFVADVPARTASAPHLHSAGFDIHVVGDDEDMLRSKTPVSGKRRNRLDAQVHISQWLNQSDGNIVHPPQTISGSVLALVQLYLIAGGKAVDQVKSDIVPGAGVLAARIAEADDKPLGNENLFRLASEHSRKR